MISQNVYQMFPPKLYSIVKYNEKKKEAYCPVCNFVLIGTVGTAINLICHRCPLDFNVFHDRNFPNIEYPIFSFILSRIFVMVELHRNNIIICNQNKSSSVPSYPISIPLFDIDFSDLDKLKNKFKLYFTFS